MTAIIAVLATGAVAWIRWPAAEPRLTTRFDYILPEGQRLQPTQRPIIAISPDGRSFVYQTSEGLFLRSMGDLETRLIPGTQVIASPFFSPDGQWVAYFTTAGPSAERGILAKVAVSGGAPITLCETSFPFGASWSRDNTIVFGQIAGIMRVPGNGGSSELLIRAGEGEQLYGPQMLPGGGSVLFSVTKELGRWDRAQVVAQSLSSSQRTVVVQGGSDARYLATGHLVYALRDGLFGVAFDVNRLTVSGSAVPLVQGVQVPVGVAAAASNYAVSDEGTLVYLAKNAFLRSLVWMHRDGTAQPIGTIPVGTYEDVRLSPDATRVLATRDGDIWIYDLASGRNSRLTRDASS
ncbi:MAG: hypothetical protein ACRD2A_17855, partial [Vicinamibacterales bacterium]